MKFEEIYILVWDHFHSPIVSKYWTIKDRYQNLNMYWYKKKKKDCTVERVFTKENVSDLKKISLICLPDSQNSKVEQGKPIKSIS